MKPKLIDFKIKINTGKLGDDISCLFCIYFEHDSVLEDPSYHDHLPNLGECRRVGPQFNNEANKGTIESAIGLKLFVPHDNWCGEWIGFDQ